MPKALLGSNGLDRRPHDITPDCWYYEEKSGLAVYSKNQGGGGQYSFIIPWRSIRASLRRHDAAKAQKGKR